MQFLEQTSLVPAWAKVLCPNATKLDLGWDTLAPHPLPQPTPHPHLQHLEWSRLWFAGWDVPPAQHLCQQLAALPSLTSLSLCDLDWAGSDEEEQQSQRLISSTTTRLEFVQEDELEDSFPTLQRVPTQFPCLRVLDAAFCVVVDDNGLEALLSMPHLERLRVRGFSLQRSHAHRAWPWVEFGVRELDVGSFTRLPLDGIPACSSWWRVQPSANAAAVARVALAIRRWGGLRGAAHGLSISGEDVAALLTTLGPLLAALPAEQQRRVSIRDLRDTSPQQVQQLGQQLPAGVAILRLDSYALPLEAWPALLPGLPATVEELELGCTASASLTAQHVAALCQAAVRPIRVVMSRYGHLTEQDLERIRASLTGSDGQPGPVTLVGS